MTSTSNISFVPCKAVLVPRKPCATRRLSVVSFARDPSTDRSLGARAWDIGAPLVAFSAAALLSSAVADASTLGSSYGGSVGGSDVMRDAQGGGREQADASRVELNLPTPNVPDPNKVTSGNTPADSIGGALDKTVANVSETFGIGSDSARQAQQGLQSSIKSGAEDLGSRAPQQLKESFRNQSQAGAEAKNGARDLLESGKEGVGRLVGDANPAGDALSGAKRLFQSGPGGDLNEAADKARSTAGKVQTDVTSAAEEGKGLLDGLFGGSGANPTEQLAGAAKSTAGKVADDSRGARDDVKGILSGLFKSTSAAGYDASALYTPVASNPIDAAKGAFKTGGAPASNFGQAQDKAVGKAKEVIGGGAKGALRAVEDASDAAQRGASGAFGGAGRDTQRAVDKAARGARGAQQDAKSAVGGLFKNTSASVYDYSTLYKPIGNPLDAVTGGSGASSFGEAQDKAVGQAKDTLGRSTRGVVNAVEGASDAAQRNVGNLFGGNAVDSAKNTASKVVNDSRGAREDAKGALGGLFGGNTNKAADKARSTASKVQTDVGRTAKEGKGLLGGLFGGGSGGGNRDEAQYRKNPTFDNAKETLKSGAAEIQKNTGFGGEGPLGAARDNVGKTASSAKSFLNTGPDNSGNANGPFGGNAPEAFKTGVQKAVSTTGDVGSGNQNSILDNLQQGVSGVLGPIRERTQNMEKGAGISGLNEQPKEAMRAGGEKSAREGKSIFGM